MADQTLTLHIPEDFYHRLKQRADYRRRSVEEELLTLASTAMVEDEIPHCGAKAQPGYPR